MTLDVAVIGAGVSGLATAHVLMQSGLNVRVLERQVDIGGNARSVRFDGFLMDLGPTTINASVPSAAEWVERLGIGADTVDLGPEVRKRYIRERSRMFGISTHPMGFFLSGLLSPQARLRMAFEMFRRKRREGGEETVHAFVRRRFGKEFADKVIDPMVAGIFMGDSKALSVTGAFPKLVDMEQRFGSITRGILAAKHGSDPGRRLFSWRDGLGVLPRAIAGALGERISTGVAVTSIRKTATGFEIKTAQSGTLRARAVVLAVQPHVAASLTSALDPATAEATAQIAAPSVSVVYLGYARAQIAHPLDGLGFLSISNSQQIIAGAQFNSTMFTHRAPKGYVAISAYVGGARDAAVATAPEADLKAMVHSELSGLLGIKGAPVVARSHCWPRGLPQYTLGHAARLETLKTTSERVPGLFLTGNYLSGVSVANCLEAATGTAIEVTGLLATPQTARRSHAI